MMNIGALNINEALEIPHKDVFWSPIYLRYVRNEVKSGAAFPAQ